MPREQLKWEPILRTTHTHTQWLINVLISEMFRIICVCVCVCVCIFKFPQMNDINQNVTVTATGTGEATLTVSQKYFVPRESYYFDGLSYYILTCTYICVTAGVAVLRSA